MTTKTADPLHTRNGSEVEKHAGLVQVRLRLSGMTPLLINAVGEDQLLAIRDKTKRAKNAARPSVRDEADGKVYRLKSGDPHIPVRILMSNFIAAGQFIRLDGKRQISTSDKTILPGMLTILSHECPLVNEKDKPATWEVDIQQGRNPNGGELVCVVRPRFDDWHLEVEIEVDQSQMPLTMARDLIDVAGSRCGLGDFRPQRKGTYGRYKVEIWEQIR